MAVDLRHDPVATARHDREPAERREANELNGDRRWVLTWSGRVG
jgi:hypothetical protein